jgi:hypothetical protein
MSNSVISGLVKCIEIQTLGPDEKVLWRVAMLSCDRNVKANRISLNLVTKTLRAYEQHGDKVIDLIWRFEGDNKEHNATFLIVPDLDADAVLGAEDADQFDKVLADT